MSGIDIFSLVIAFLCAFTAGWYFSQKEYVWAGIEIVLMALNLILVFT